MLDFITLKSFPTGFEPSKHLKHITVRWFLWRDQPLKARTSAESLVWAQQLPPATK